jgi:uncharacterized protein YcbK (DUF882 family)
MGDLTEHFSWSEFQCRDGSEMPPPVKLNIPRTAQMLEAIRARIAQRFGERAVIVLSGYRSPEYNKRVGGTPRSQHLLGKAADIVVPGLTPSQVQKICEELQNEGIVGGLGRYPGFTHVDWGPKRSWTYEDKQRYMTSLTSGEGG